MKRTVGRHWRKGYTYVNRRGSLVSVTGYPAGNGPLKAKAKNAQRSTRAVGFFRDAQHTDPIPNHPEQLQDEP